MGAMGKVRGRGPREDICRSVLELGSVMQRDAQVALEIMRHHAQGQLMSHVRDIALDAGPLALAGTHREMVFRSFIVNA